MGEGNVAIIGELSGKGAYFVKGVYDYLKGKDERDFPIKLIDIETTVFPDKEFKVKIKDNIRGRECFFIHDANQDPALWYTKLNFVLGAMRFSNPKSICAILPYFRYGRQERKDESRVSVGAKEVAECISRYAERGMSVDLHAAQIQEYFSVPFDNLYSFPSLINYLKQNHPEILEDLVIASPDTGGTWRVESLRKRLKKAGIDTGMAVGYKLRDRKGKLEGIELNGQVQDCNVLVLDDIISTGGTMCRTAEIARKKGAKLVYGYGTHGLFTSGTEQIKKAFNVFMVGDTLAPPNDDKIEIVSLINLFGEAIYLHHTNQSLSALFE